MNRTTDDAAEERSKPVEKNQVALEQIKTELEIAKYALRGGLIATLAGFVLVLLMECLSVFLFFHKGVLLISGTHIVIAFGILSFSIVIYSSYVFRVSMEARGKVPGVGEGGVKTDAGTKGN